MVQPAEYQPRLTLWGRTWRVGLVLVISGVAWFEPAQWQWHNAMGWFIADLSIGLISLMLMLWRRQFPVTVAVATAAASGISWSTAGPATLALVSLSTRRRWREIVPVAALSLVVASFQSYLNPVGDDPFLLTGTAVVLIIGVSIGWGLFIGSRRELLATLHERARRAETEQARQIEQSRSAERSRIAREMHDVLAHRISTVAMHAGALSYRTDLSADEIRHTANVLQNASHQALTELREVLGILRGDPDETSELPQPLAAMIPDLIFDARATGMNVEFDNDLGLGTVPAAIGRTLYRVVQEGLTNARKHAPHTLVQVTLKGSPGGATTATVCNLLNIGDARVRAPASGLGLVGLTERVELVGGRLKYTITDAREFILDVSLPWPA